MRQTAFAQTGIFEILVQQPLEFRDYIVVDLGTCDELTVIKTHTVVKEQFDIRGNQTFAVLVYRMFHLITDFVNAVHKNFTFPFRHMQCLVHIV